MPRNKVYMIVEGHGEAKAPKKGEEPAATIMAAKLLRDLECWSLTPAKRAPWRMRSCGDFYTSGKLENALRAHTKYKDCAAVLVLFDLDDGCPKEVAIQIALRVQKMENLPFSVVIVCAKREYEAWFLASLETIHPGYIYENDPEAPRDAKGWLRREFGYKETRDQANYTQSLHIPKAKERSRSFRRLYKAFEELIEAAEKNQPIITPSGSH